MSDFDSTEEFSNESDNWESAEDISENDYLTHVSLFLC